MRKTKEVLRLHFGLGMTRRDIARSLGISHSTVGDVIRRAKALGLSWPLPEDLCEADLERRMYTQRNAPRFARAPIDMQWVHRELARKGVTLQLLWFEYKQEHPDGYQYSQFCQHYHDWCRKLDLVMRQSHRAGEKMFVDFAGQTVPVANPQTGEIKPAYIFVAVLGASNYTFAEATPGQDLFSWITAHCHALEFFGGVPEIIVPDNPKAGVSRACRYEPDLNPTYQEMACHYGTVVIPARPRKPRDKAKVEVGVQVVERWILAALRNRTFFSLAELNRAIAKLLDRLNERPFRKLAGSRRQLFDTLDRPALKPLPAQPYEFAQWRKLRVNIDYHVEIEDNYYSVPHQLVRQEVEARITASLVEIFHKGQRVASHARAFGQGKYLTEERHMPLAHRQHLEWSPSRIMDWAGTVGPYTRELVKTVLQTRPHPEQGYRTSLGIIRLGRYYPPERLEAAAKKALACHALSYRSLKSILEKGLDRLPEAEPITVPTLHHQNLRGPAYYFNRQGGDQC